jgi:hypothetical protein
MEILLFVESEMERHICIYETYSFNHIFNNPLNVLLGINLWKLSGNALVLVALLLGE